MVSSDGRVTGTLVQSGVRAAGSHLVVFVHGGGCNSRYFDLKGLSCAQAALQRGHDVLLVNRPGHGGSAPPQTDSPIGEAAELLIPFIALARERCQAKRLAMIGHSIGGAVVIETAARHADWPLTSVAVSGIGDGLTRESLIWLDAVLEGAPAEPPAEYFFGPEGSYGWQGPAALRRSSEPWRLDEVIEVMRDWPARFLAAAAQVRVPVHFRMAEYERIWDHSQEARRRIAAAFAAGAGADVGLLPDGGHLYEIHKRGPELIAAQLDFIERVAAA